MTVAVDAGTAPPRRPEAASLFHRYRFANVEFDESLGQLRVAGVEVAIEPRPRNLLSELLRRPNEVVAKDELLDLLWDGRPTVDNVLANAVNKLRKALGEEAGARVVSLARVGYRLAGPVERIAVGQQPLAVASDMVVGQAVPGREAFKLERSLGYAARAEVWLARDPKLHEIRVFKFASDSERLTALKREYTLYRVLRRELGERDDFARVVSANFSGAPYFLECEYGGPDLLAWAAEGDRLTAMPAPERLTLFVQIARAVAAAHGVGVLHKDLKPANVLIGPSGDGWAAKLTDFGSSRLLEPARLAQLGVTALGLTLTQGVSADTASGTPLYLAPELLAGQSPTMQSDLYALGLMLYQLLAGDFRRPMATGWQRDIGDELLRDDLTAATEGRPQDRLGSVAELVERLVTLEQRREQRVQHEKSAREAAEALAALHRSRERRPWLMAGVASLLLGLAASLWFYNQSRLSLVETQKQMARAQAINDFLNKDVLLGADVTMLDAEKPASMLEVLNRASAGAAERFRGDPVTEASVRAELASIFYGMAANDAAEAEYHQALARLSPVVAADDPLLLTLRFRLAQVVAVSASSRLAEAKTQLESAERDAGADALRAETTVSLAASKARFSYLFMHGDLKDALEPGTRMVGLADRLAPTDLRQQFDARTRLAELHFRLGDFEQAQALLTRTLTAPFTPKTVGEVAYARTRLGLARVHRATGNLEGVEAALLEGRDVLVRRLGPNEFHSANANNELASLYNSRAEFGRAAQALRAAHASFLATMGAQDQSTRVVALNLAITELNNGDAATALASLEKDRPWFVTTFGGAANAVVQSIDFQRARALSDLHRPAEALQLLNGLSHERLAEAEPGRDWPWKLQAEKGRALVALGKAEEGAPLLTDAIEKMQALDSPKWVIAGYRSALDQRLAQRQK